MKRTKRGVVNIASKNIYFNKVLDIGTDIAYTAVKGSKAMEEQKYYDREKYSDWIKEMARSLGINYIYRPKYYSCRFRIDCFGGDRSRTVNHGFSDEYVYGGY